MYRTHLSDSQRSTRNMAATGRQCQACTRRGRSAGKSAHVVLGPSHVMEVIVEVREVIMEVRLSMLASVLNIETLCFNADINVQGVYILQVSPLLRVGKNIHNFLPYF